MGGVSMAPMAETSAIVEPEIPEKKYSASTTDMPRPPRTQPIIARARSTSAYDIPHRSMRLPAKMKVGMASSTQLCEPATRLEGSFCSEKLPTTSPVKPAMPSEKTMAARRSSAPGTSPPRRRRASGRSAPGVRGGGGAVDDHQQAADHRRQVQPAEVEVECRRVGLRVQLGDLPAVIREQRPKADEQHVVADADAAAERGGKLVGDDVHGEMRAAADADGGADEGQPGQRVFADLFHPEEAHRRQVERRRDPGHHVAQEDADEHVDHGHDHQRRHHDVRRPADDAKEGGHDGADRTGSTRRASSARRRAANLTRPRGRANVARRQEASMSRGQRSVAWVAVVVAMMLAGGSVKPAPSQAQSGAKKLDLAHIMPPPESGAIGYKYFADEVTKRSNGTLNVVFHGGTLL